MHCYQRTIAFDGALFHVCLVCVCRKIVCRPVEVGLPRLPNVGPGVTQLVANHLHESLADVQLKEDVDASVCNEAKSIPGRILVIGLIAIDFKTKGESEVNKLIRYLIMRR